MKVKLDKVYNVIDANFSRKEDFVMYSGFWITKSKALELIEKLEREITKMDKQREGA